MTGNGKGGASPEEKLDPVGVPDDLQEVGIPLGIEKDRKHSGADPLAPDDADPMTGSAPVPPLPGDERVLSNEAVLASEGPEWDPETAPRLPRPDLSDETPPESDHASPGAGVEADPGPEHEPVSIRPEAGASPARGLLARIFGRSRAAPEAAADFEGSDDAAEPSPDPHPDALQLSDPGPDAGVDAQGSDGAVPQGGDVVEKLAVGPTSEGTPSSGRRWFRRRRDRPSTVTAVVTTGPETSADQTGGPASSDDLIGPPAPKVMQATNLEQVDADPVQEVKPGDRGRLPPGKKSKRGYPPIQVLMGWIDESSRRDVLEHARGFAADHIETLDTAWIAMAEFRGGTLFEIHEGGGGYGYLDNLIEEMSRDPDQVLWVPSGTRLNRVVTFSIVEGRPFTMMLNETDSARVRNSGRPAIERTGRMRRLVPRGTPVMVTGATLFTVSLCALLASAFLSSRLDQQPLPSLSYNPDTLPHGQIISLSNALREDRWVSRILFENGTWRAEFETFEDLVLPEDTTQAQRLIEQATERDTLLQQERDPKIEELRGE